MAAELLISLTIKIKNNSMRSITLLALRYFVIWIILSIGYFFSSETITKWIAPGYDNVQLWLSVVAVGLILIFVPLTISFFIRLRRHKKFLKPS